MDVLIKGSIVLILLVDEAMKERLNNLKFFTPSSSYMLTSLRMVLGLIEIFTLAGHYHL